MNAAVCRTVAVHGGERRGMTLVELLIVAGLIAVFLGLVVVGVRGGRQAQKRGADTLASTLAVAQARALGVPEGAAVILATGTGTETNAAAACTSVFDAVMQPLIEATATGLPPSPVSAISAPVMLAPTTGDDVQRAYKIRVSGTQAGAAAVAPATAWLGFAPSSATSGTVQFRTMLGQTPNNTVWPKPLAGGTFSASLAQYPVRSSAMVQLDEGIAIDLGFSGIGDDRSTAYGRLDGKGAIAVVFDRVGRVAEIIQQVPEPGPVTFTSGTVAPPAIPVGTIYFLVAPRDVIASGSNTLSRDDAQWVALSPQTGRIFVADNVPQSASDTGALRDARAKVRQGIGVGR